MRSWLLVVSVALVVVVVAVTSLAPPPHIQLTTLQHEAGSDVAYSLNSNLLALLKNDVSKPTKSSDDVYTGRRGKSNVKGRHNYV